MLIVCSAGCGRCVLCLLSASYWSDYGDDVELCQPEELAVDYFFLILPFCVVPLCLVSARRWNVIFISFIPQNECYLYSSVTAVCLGLFRGLWAGDLNADWLEGTRFVTFPAPVCRHFNHHRDFRPFFHFGQPQDLKLRQNRTHYITALLAAKSLSVNFMISWRLFCPI